MAACHLPLMLDPEQARHAGVPGGAVMARCQPPDLARNLNHTIAEALHTPGVVGWRKYSMCPLCSHVVRPEGNVSQHDPLTLVCRGRKSCAARRAELDDETIEFLGLVPRGKDEVQHGQA